MTFKNNFLVQNKNNELIGVVGRIKDSILNEKYKINQKVYVICLNLDLAFKNINYSHNIYKINDLNPIYKEITFTNKDKIDLKDVIKKVMEVSYPQDLLDSVNRNIQKISLFLLGLAALLTLISFALINNTIRLSIYSKRFLIHTMKLVGASWAFIRRPFLIRNMWIGILAGFMADAILIGLAIMLLKYEPELIDIITPGTMFIVMGLVFVFGLAITCICAYISINKYLRMKASELYYI